jgi:archaellum biogenesis ATPase FlaH
MKTKDLKTNLDWALYYLHRGWSVIPVGKNKRPLIEWKEYQRRFPTEEEIKTWFSKPNVMGMAIITGSLSKLLVLDIEKDADLTGIETSPTITSKTGGGGEHRYFRYPSTGTIHNSAKQINEKMDIRGEGGYVVAPPSLHPSGNHYKWFDLCSPDEIELDEIPKWLYEKITLSNQKKNIKEITGGVKQGSRNESATSLVGKLLSYLPKDEWENIGWQYLIGWNERNIPPLPMSEIKNVFESIAKRESEKRGVNTKRERSKPLSVGDVFSMAIEPQPFLVDKMVPERGMTAFSGYPESGKSWVTLHIAYCVATGQPTFGKFATKQGGVLMIDEEAGNAEFHKRMRMFGFKGKEEVYLYSQEEFKVDSKDDLKHLVDTAKSLEVKLVIFDPFSAIHNKTENNAEEMQRVMEALQQFNLAGIAVIFIHHHRKEHYMARNTSASMGLRGSTVLFARLDCHVAIKKEKETEQGLHMSIEQAKLRRDSKFKPFTVELKIDKETNSAVFVYVGEVEEKLVKKEEAMEFILNELEEQSPQTTQELIAKAKEGSMGKNAVEEALKEMRVDKLVMARRITGKGTALHYSLPEMKDGEQTVDIKPPKQETLPS